MNSRFRSKMTVILAVALLSNISASQPADTTEMHGFFIRSGGWALSISSGTLHKVTAEVTYGVSDGLTIGFVGSPMVAGGTYGIRATARVMQISQRSQIYFSTPFLYVSQMENVFGGESALFFWPCLMAEFGGTRSTLYAGVGAVSAVWFLTVKEPASLPGPFGPLLLGYRETRIPTVYFRNTLHAGMALPLQESTRVHMEAILLLSGLDIESQNWLGGSPFILSLTLSQSIK